MTQFEAILYGAVQGATEYLPVSSSAHLILLPKFLGTEDPGLAFDVFLHLGTLLSTLAYFWRDWIGVLSTLPMAPTGWRQKYQVENPVSWVAIAIGTVPALAAGAILHDWVEGVFRGPEVLVWTLSLGGIALFLIDHFLKRERPLKTLSLKDAWIIGLLQCLALVPGVSRSGATIMAGRLLQFDRPAAARFSFLLSAPVTLAAVLYEMKKAIGALSDPAQMDAWILGAIAAFFFGWLAIAGLLRLVRRFGYLSFAIYRCVLAAIVWRLFVQPGVV